MANVALRIVCLVPLILLTLGALMIRAIGYPFTACRKSPEQRETRPIINAVLPELSLERRAHYLKELPGSAKSRIENDVVDNWMGEITLRAPLFLAEIGMANPQVDFTVQTINKNPPGTLGGSQNWIMNAIVKQDHLLPSSFTVYTTRLSIGVVDPYERINPRQIMSNFIDHFVARLDEDAPLY